MSTNTFQAIFATVAAEATTRRPAAAETSGPAEVATLPGTSTPQQVRQAIAKAHLHGSPIPSLPSNPSFHPFPSGSIMNTNTFKAIVTTVTAGLLLTSTAMAASLQPAAGEQPFFDAPAAVASAVDRATVAAEAATRHPAAGEMSGTSEVAAAQSTLTRQQVREATAEAGLHGSRFPAASGMNS